MSLTIFQSTSPEMGTTLKINPVLQYVKEVRETKSIEETVQVLSSGNWIAICAISCEGGYLFSMGRVR